MIRVKVCGITRPGDAVAAEEAGAAYVGTVQVPGSPRKVEPAAARRVADAVSIPLAVVLADVDAPEAAWAADRSGARVIQLHGTEPPETFVRLRELGPWELWKGVRVRSRGDIAGAVVRWGAVADLLLLDGWHAARLGGTGTPFPWEALEEMRAGLPPGLRLGVAGGLEPGNVEEAVRRLGPDLVDASSGLETRPGVKDPERIRRFLAAAAGPRAPGADRAAGRDRPSSPPNPGR